MKLILLVGDLGQLQLICNMLFKIITYYTKVVTLKLPCVGKQQNNISYPFPFILLQIMNVCNFSTLYEK
jgi:hypothetical protein